MRNCQFNFNNEVDTFAIQVEDDGKVTVSGEGGEVMAEYASVRQLAETYALARDVKPENLKNWELLENGDVFSFVLRAGTAGVDVADVEDRLEEVFASLEGKYHPLNIARAKEQIMGDAARDLTEALVRCMETDIARDVYDAMNEPEDAAAVEAEPEDTRTELEKYLDQLEGRPGALSVVAIMASIPADSEKTEIRNAVMANYALSNVDTLRTAYGNALREAMGGIGVDTEADALAIITQTAVGTKDDAAKSRMVAAARLAGRDRVNLSVDVVGRLHILHTAQLVALEELEGTDLLIRGNVPYIVRFDEGIDAELEARREQQADAGFEGEYEDESEDGYNGDYEDEY